MISVGRYSVDVVETCRFGLDGGAMFGVVPKTLWERVYTKADEKNRIPMAAKALLLRSDEQTILVDTGNSPLMSPKLQEIYGIDFSQYTLQGSLNALGVQPSDVTDVILTHLHFDHSGGAMSADGPTFPNAMYYVQREHYKWALNPTEKDRASFMPEFYQPIVDAGKMEFLDGADELFPDVYVDLVHGHTRALQTVRVVDGDACVFYPADLMPTGAHIGIPYGMGYDNFPLTTMEEKKVIVPQAIAEKWIVVFEHDALRQAAIIEQGERGPVLGSDIVIT